MRPQLLTNQALWAFLVACAAAPAALSPSTSKE